MGTVPPRHGEEHQGGDRAENRRQGKGRDDHLEGLDGGVAAAPDEGYDRESDRQLHEPPSSAGGAGAATVTMRRQGDAG